MDLRPIGIFDSGLGGLTAVREVMARLPGEDIIYFGDTGRVPYGTRSREAILKYARQDVRFLRTFDIKTLLVACNTVSTAAISELTAESDIPLFGVVEPSVRKAAQVTKNGRIGLIGTTATIASGAYGRGLSALLPSAQIISLACPLFVPLVENGRFSRGDVVVETVAREYLEPVRKARVDTLILGCTHYPLLKDVIADIMGPEVALIDSGAQAAEALAQALRESGLLAPDGRRGSADFYVSDSAELFTRYASVFLNREVTGSVRKIDIERY